MPSFYIKGVAIFRVQYLTATELARCLKFINKVSSKLRAKRATFTMLPVSLYSIGQKLEENAKIGNATFLVTLNNVCLPG